MAVRTTHQVLLIACAAGINCLLLVTTPLTGAEQKIFTSSKYHYQLRLPKSWNVSVAESGIPVFFNYPKSEAGPQGLFPPNGANIYLIPFAAVKVTTPTTDFKTWIQLNSERDHSGVTILRMPDPAGTMHGPHKVSEIRADFERDPQDEALQREVNYYFQLGEDYFRLRLLYWKGDSRAAYFESVLTSIFRSIREL